MIPSTSSGLVGQFQQLLLANAHAQGAEHPDESGHLEAMRARSQSWIGQDYFGLKIKSHESTYLEKDMLSLLYRSGSCPRFTSPEHAYYGHS